MAARLANAKPSPEVMTGVQHLFKAVYAGGVSNETLELVHLRVSQINGCSACVDAGSKSATKAGVSTQRLLAVSAWYESPLFTEAERAALALAEAATRLPDRPGSEERRVGKECSLPCRSRWSPYH